MERTRFDIVTISWSGRDCMYKKTTEKRLSVFPSNTPDEDIVKEMRNRLAKERYMPKRQITDVTVIERQTVT